MKSKTEIDLHFDYYDDPEFVKYDNENIALSILFSIPVIGQTLLVLSLLYELLCKWLKIVRVMGKRIIYLIGRL